MTKEEIARAKELDLLTYFKLVEPGNLKLVGKEYRHKVHSSLTISKDSLWCWHCIGLRGRTALKYLIDVEKVPYVEAVREMVDKTLRKLMQTTLMPDRRVSSTSLVTVQCSKSAYT